MRLTGMGVGLVAVDHPMKRDRQLPCVLDIANHNYDFAISWTSVDLLQFEIVPRANDEQVIYEGRFKAETKASRHSIRRLYTYLERLQKGAENVKQEMTTSMTVVECGGRDNPLFKLRIMMLAEWAEEDSKKANEILEYHVEKTVKTEAALLEWKMERMQREKDKEQGNMAIIRKEMDEKFRKNTKDIQQAFEQNFEGIATTLMSQFQRALQASQQQQMPPRPAKKEDEDSETQGRLGQKEFEKKLKKKLMKQIKKKEKERRRRKIKEKKREKRKQKKIKKLIKRLQENGEEIDGLEISETNIEQFAQDHKGEEGQGRGQPGGKEIANDSAIEANINHEPQQRERHKKHKSKHKPRKEEENRVVMPVATNLFEMGRLRNQRPQPATKPPIAVNMEQDESVQVIEKRLPSRKFKTVKKPKDAMSDFDSEGQRYERNAERKFNEMINEIRKQGGIDKMPASRNPKILTLAVPKPPLIERDEFNPTYNGQPRYQPFVKLNQNREVRAKDLFIGRLVDPGQESSRIPIVFMEDTACYPNFEVKGNLVTKQRGNEYQQIVFDHVIPRSGTHCLTMHLLESHRSYVWMGVIDAKAKNRQSSFQEKNTITFSLHSGHVVSSCSWSPKPIGKTEAGLQVRMEVSIAERRISWFISNGKNISSKIHKRISGLNLVPYVEIREDLDQVAFED